MMRGTSGSGEGRRAVAAGGCRYGVGTAGRGAESVGCTVASALSAGQPDSGRRVWATLSCAGVGPVLSAGRAGCGRRSARSRVPVALAAGAECGQRRPAPAETALGAGQHGFECRSTRLRAPLNSTADAGCGQRRPAPAETALGAGQHGFECRSTRLRAPGVGSAVQRRPELARVSIRPTLGADRLVPSSDQFGCRCRVWQRCPAPVGTGLSTDRPGLSADQPDPSTGRPGPEPIDPVLSRSTRPECRSNRLRRRSTWTWVPVDPAPGIECGRRRSASGGSGPRSRPPRVMVRAAVGVCAGRRESEVGCRIVVPGERLKRQS